MVSTPDWVNVQTYGADPTNTSDSTIAFEDALTALGTAGGGVLYIPAGEYIISSSLNWTSGDSITICGDGEGISTINRASATAPFHTFDIENVTGSVTVRDLTILNTISAANFTDDQVGLYFGGCQLVRVENVHIDASADRVNIAVKLNDCTTVSFVTCALNGYVNALYMYNNTAVVDCIGTSFGTNAGSGVSNSGNIVMIETSGTLHLTNCETNSGDHGLVTSGSGGQAAFIFINDLEINNCHGHAVELNVGSEFWANQLWCSNQGVSNSEAAYDGVYIGSGYTGWVVIDNSTIQHYSGSGVSILGGKSYWITNSSFTGCCGFADNSYYDIYLSNCSNVVMTGNHFDVDPWNNINRPNAGVCISSNVSNVILSLNQFATSGYHTGAVINNGTNVIDTNNLT